MTPREERTALAIGAACMLVVGATVCGFATMIERRNCYQRWQGSSLAARFDWRLGCQVRTDLYGWVPEQNFNASWHPSGERP